MFGSSTRMVPAAALRGLANLAQTLALALLIHALKGGERHDDLAAHLKVRRYAGILQSLRRDGQRDRAHGAHIGGHVFAH